MKEFGIMVSQAVSKPLDFPRYKMCCKMENLRLVCFVLRMRWG